MVESWTCHDSNALMVCTEFSYEFCYDTASNQSLWYHIKKDSLRWILYNTFISITILQMWLITIWHRGREWAARVCDVVPWHLSVVWRIVRLLTRIYDVTFWNLNNALLRIYAMCGELCGWGVSPNERKSQFNFIDMHNCVYENQNHRGILLASRQQCGRGACIISLWFS